MTSTREDHGHGEQDDHAMGDVLDLDTEVFAAYTASIVDWLPAASAERIVDLGCGPGGGTVALLARFPRARVTAVDASESHLRRVRDKVASVGATDRVTTVLADLDDVWPEVSRPDLVWASASLHHLADPEAALSRLHDLLAPGGLLVVVEPDGFPYFLPEDGPAFCTGLEARAHDVIDRRTGEAMPFRGADFAPALAAAGFTVEARRSDTVIVQGSGSDPVVRYADGGLRRLRGALADALPGEDLAALDRLLDPDDPEGLAHREDLAARTTRTVWAARVGSR